MPLPDVDATHTDGPALRVVCAHDEQHERALARAARAHDADALAGRHLEAEVLEHGCLGPRRVGEGHVREGDGEAGGVGGGGGVGANGRGCGRGGRPAVELARVGRDVDARHGLNDAEQVAGGRARARDLAHERADLAEGERAEQHGHEGRDDLPAREAAVEARVVEAGRVVFARLEDEHGAGVARDAVHHVEGGDHDADGDAHAAALRDARRLGGQQEEVVAARLVRLAAEGADGAREREDLVGRAARARVGQAQLLLARDARDDEQAERDGEHGRAGHDDERQLPALGEADRQAAHEAARVAQHGRHLVHARRHGDAALREARHGLARLVRVVPGEVEAQQVPGVGGAQARHHVLRRDADEHRLGEGQHARADGDEQEVERVDLDRVDDLRRARARVIERVQAVAEDDREEGQHHARGHRREAAEARHRQVRRRRVVVQLAEGDGRQVEERRLRLRWRASHIGA